MSEDVPKGPSDEDVIALAKEAIEAARGEVTRRAQSDADGTPKELHPPGITIDLGHNNLHKLPDEVIDIIKDDIERLALYHNSLATLPLTLPQCTRLRYLNVRWNQMREIPPPVLQLSALEILDVSKNKLRSLPDDIANLTSLKVLAIQKNKIDRLPVTLAEITSLQVLKLDGNPITFPPPEVCTLKPDTPSPANENEKDAQIATQVKRYFRQLTTRERLRVDSEGESSEGNVETPKPPKRVASGRFPIKPSLENLQDPRPGSPGAPPPIPTRSHFRVKSQQNAAPRRPNVSPLIIGNERNRSQSEGGTSASIRAKRMGIISRKNPDLEALNELKSKRLSHLRGLSHGSVLSGSTLTNGSLKSAASANFGDSGTQRTGVRPLSDLLEHKRRSRAPDVVVEASKGLLFSMSELHDPLLKILRPLKLENDGARVELTRRFSTAYSYVKELGGLLRQFDTLAEEDEEEAEKLSKAVRGICHLCLKAIEHLGQALLENTPAVLREGDPRYIRKLITQFHLSLVEVRNACSVLGVNFRHAPKPPRLPETARYTPTPGRALARARSRANTATLQNPNLPELQYPAMPPIPLTADSSRSNTMLSAPTPRSGETFLRSEPMSRTSTMQSMTDDLDEERQFERIFLKLRAACDATHEYLPFCKYTFMKAKEVAQRDVDPSRALVDSWSKLIDRCDDVWTASLILGRRLAGIKFKDPAARNQHDFWQLCTAFVKAYTDVATSVKEMTQLGLIEEDIRQALKPIHKATKDVSAAITNSPWSHLAVRNPTVPPTPVQPPLSAAGPTPPTAYHYPIPGGINTGLASHYTQSVPSTMGYMTPVPPTPLSAALGPAAQATVPSTPGPMTAQFIVQQGPPGIALSVGTGFYPGMVVERTDRHFQTQQRRF